MAKIHKWAGSSGLLHYYISPTNKMYHTFESVNLEGLSYKPTKFNNDYMPSLYK